MNLRSISILGFLLGISLHTPTPADTPPPAKYPEPRFEAAIQAYENQDRKQFPPPHAIVAYGSSSLLLWHENIREDLAPLTIIPRGFGGSNMYEALHYADRIALNYKPRAILIYEGDNDLAQGIPPETIRDTFLELVARIHTALPETKIYILSIKPSIAREKLWPQAQITNRMLAEASARDERIIYVDLAAGMLDQQGKVQKDIFLADNLHMNRKGYEIWRDILRPVLLKRELAAENQPAADKESPKQTSGK